MALVAVSLAVSSIIFSFCPLAKMPIVKFSVVGFWAVVPAIWLFFEWFYLLKPALESEEKQKSIELEIVKHEQSVVRAMWAAFLIVVAAAYGVGPFEALANGTESQVTLVKGK